jgi:hypothetical protein
MKKSPNSLLQKGFGTREGAVKENAIPEVVEEILGDA